jgi:hypothetical protein
MVGNDYSRRPSTRGDQFNPANPFRTTKGRLNEDLISLKASCRVYGWNQTLEIWEPTMTSAGFTSPGVQAPAKPNNVMVFLASPSGVTVPMGTFGWLAFVQGVWFFSPDCEDEEAS